MASSKKRTLTFQTPKKKAMTPLRSAGRSIKSEEKEDRHTPGKNDETTLENKLIEAYRQENNLLRNLKQDTLLYTKLLGITITENDNIIKFTIERSSTTGPKKLKFNLEDKNDIFVFTLENSENCNIPEYFYDVIEFEKKAFPLFFYKAMQSVYEARSNE